LQSPSRLRSYIDAAARKVVGRARRVLTPGAQALRAQPQPSRTRGYIGSFRQVLPTDAVAKVQDIQLLVPDGPGASVGPRILTSGYTEREFTEFAQAVVRPGMNVVDVGASMGYFTCLFARWVGPEGSVIAFEPWPEALNYLSSNVEGNAFGNVNIESVALFDETGAAHVAAGSYRVTRGTSRGSRAVDVELARLDDVPSVQRLQRLDAIKIDIEGAELRALHGMTESIRRWRPFLLIEVHPDFLPLYGDSVDDLQAFLRQFGYEGVIVENWRGTGAAHHLVAAPRAKLEEARFVPAGERRTVFHGERAAWHAPSSATVRESQNGRGPKFEFELGERGVAYAVSPKGPTKSVPDGPATDLLLPERYTRILWMGSFSPNARASVWVFQYDDHALVRSRSFPIEGPEHEWSMLSARGGRKLRVGLRLSGTGFVEVERLQIDQWA